MSVLGAFLKNDLRILYRSGFVMVSAIIIMLFGWGASQLTLTVSGQMAPYVSPIVILLAVMSPFLTIGIMLLTERNEGILTSQAVMPPPPWQLLLMRTLVVSVFSAAEMMVLFSIAFRGSVDPAMLLVGLLSIAIISALIGVFVVAPFTALHEYLVPMTLVVLFLSVPALAVFWQVDPQWLYWHPMAPAQQFINAALGAKTQAAMPFAVAGTLVWIGIAGGLALNGMDRMRRAATE